MTAIKTTAIKKATQAHSFDSTRLEVAMTPLLSVSTAVVEMPSLTPAAPQHVPIGVPTVGFITPSFLMLIATVFIRICAEVS